MKVNRILSQIETISILHPDIVVENTAAEFLLSHLAPGVKISTETETRAGHPDLRIGVLGTEEAAQLNLPVEPGSEWRFIRIQPDGRIELYASHSWFLYRLANQLVDDWAEEDAATFTEGKVLKAAFRHLRPAYDSLLNNHARTAKGFDPETHIREMARLGFTHVEVNGLAATFP